MAQPSNPRPPMRALYTEIQHHHKKLKARRLGCIDLSLAVCHQTEKPWQYKELNLCAALHQNIITKAFIYVDPKHYSNHTGDPKKTLLHEIQKAAIKGGDQIASHGGRDKKNKVDRSGVKTEYYLRCQCARLYEGDKCDTRTGTINLRGDIRVDKLSNNRQNNRHGDIGKNGSHRTDTHRRTDKSEKACAFNITLY